MAKIIIEIAEHGDAEYVVTYLRKYSPVIMSHTKDIRIITDEVKLNLKEYFELEQRNCSHCMYQEISPIQLPCSLCVELSSFKPKQP